MEYIIFNSLIKSTLNKFLWYNIKSATKGKKKVPRKVKNSTEYVEVDDYIIEYRILYGDGKVKMDNFTHSSYLSDFGNKEKSFITQLIKLRTAVATSASTVVTETVIA
jgi:hypothetical protein